MTFTNSQANETASAIANEFFTVENDIRISKMGLSRLTGVSVTAISKYITRFNLSIQTADKWLETRPGRGSNLSTATLSSDDATDIIYYYACESKEINSDSRKQSQSILKAFTKRGYLAWVQDVLNLSVDTTAANTQINALLGLYPGLEYLTDSQVTDKGEIYLTARQYLLEVKGLKDDAEKFRWFQTRLPNLASSTYRSLKQHSPNHRIYNAPGILANVKTYLLSEIPILDMAYDQIEMQWTDYRFIADRPLY